MIDFKKVDGRNAGDIKLFALSTCGWCKKTKQFFADEGLAYSYVDVDTLPQDELGEASQKQREYNASGSFPTIVVDGKDVIIGYDIEALNKLAGKK